MLGDPGRLRELEIFALVAAEGSFSAAARASGLTPSAVSKTISRLEGRLGARLIVRNTRALTLTAEGEDLHRRALASHSLKRETGRRSRTGGSTGTWPTQIRTTR